MKWDSKTKAKSSGEVDTEHFNKMEHFILLYIRTIGHDPIDTSPSGSEIAVVSLSCTLWRPSRVRSRPVAIHLVYC